MGPKTNIFKETSYFVQYVTWKIIRQDSTKIRIPLHENQVQKRKRG